MARLGKTKLLEIATAAFQAAGWKVQQTSAPKAFPVYLTMARAGQTVSLCVYIWNLTHGGGSKRPKSEYRIQVTSGVRSFQRPPNCATLILGWSTQFGVFAAFDASSRTGKLGASPSIQITQESLQKAGAFGAALQDKGHGEFAVAIRPDRLASYVTHQTQAHAGDISPLVLYPGDKIDSERQGAKFGQADELAKRQEIIDRIEALEKEIERLRPARRDRGHNKPPEMLPDQDNDLADQVLDKAQQTKKELKDSLPDVVLVANNGRFFEWLGQAVRAIKAEGIRTARAIRDKARENVAGLIVASLTVGTPFWHQIAQIAADIANAIAQWIDILF